MLALFKANPQDGAEEAISCDIFWTQPWLLVKGNITEDTACRPGLLSGLAGDPNDHIKVHTKVYPSRREPKQGPK